jgi:hypothetical protein
MDKALRMRVKCRCGGIHTCFLERRERNRKRVALEGTLARGVGGFDPGMSRIHILDISETGLGFQLVEEAALRPTAGLALRVKFRLNERPGAAVAEQVNVRYCRGDKIGSQFKTRISFSSNKVLKIFLEGAR